MISPITITKTADSCSINCDSFYGMYEGIKIMTRLKPFCDKFNNQLILIGDFDDIDNSVIIHKMHSHYDNETYSVDGDGFSDICNILGLKYQDLITGIVHQGTPPSMVMDRNTAELGAHNLSEFLTKVSNSF